MTDLRHNRGVTLVEMLVVLGIILVLSGIVISVTLRVDNQSKEHTLHNAFALVGSSLREYYEFTGRFPPQPQQDPTKALAHIEAMLQELRAVPAARKVLDQVSVSLIKSESDPMGADLRSLRDPWGTVLDYFYVPGNTCPELISAGPDRRFGTADDLSSKCKR